jgi:TPP-dependent 2-oxoacid decarboxylase
MFLTDIEAYRFKIAKEIVKLVEKMGLPCCTSVLAKGAFPMNHPLYMGVYAGAVSPPGIRQRVGGDGLYLAQGFYASMGFAVPGALGAQIGTRLRPLVLTGDGGFQMTGVEIAHAPRYKLNPIVVLLNNGGWRIFRPIAKRQDLLALPSWRYAELARLWGGRGFWVETVAQLHRALEQAAKSSDFAIIEVSIGPQDLSPITIKYIRASAKKAQIKTYA